METGFNKTIIIGRLGNEPELKHGSKVDYCQFTISNVVIKNGDQDVQWHSITVFGKQAQLCTEYLKKGDLVCIEGRFDSQVCEKDGEKRTKQIIIAEKVVFLSSKTKEV